MKKNNHEGVMHNISFFTLKSRFANVSERLTLRFQRWLAASSNQIEKQLVNQNLISSLLDLLKLQFMQFKWWGRGNASSLHASHCCVLGEQGRRIIACGAQLSVPQHQCLSESDAGEAKTSSLSIWEINVLWAAVESCLGYRWPR